MKRLSEIFDVEMNEGIGAVHSEEDKIYQSGETKNAVPRFLQIAARCIV